MGDTNFQLDRYEIREKIGTGGMARVYKAWDISLKRLVAVKVLHEHLADDPTFKQRFEREAQFIANFNHPNIVQVYDFKMTDTNGDPLYFMVMQYVPGKTLRDLIDESKRSRTPLNQKRVFRIVRDIASALGYAHARGMAHRDVKPGNILLDENDRAILTDFGIARLVQSSRLTQDGVSTGTPVYMSPEQASGQAGDGRSDLYSLGIILYEMLAGEPPFQDESSLSVMLKHLNEPITPLSVKRGITDVNLDNFIQHALAKSPEDRFPTAQGFITELEAAFGENVTEGDVGDGRTVNLPVAPISADNRTPSQVMRSTTGTAVATNTTSSQVMQTLTQAALTHPRTSTGLAIGVLAIIIVLFAVVLINQQAVSNLISQAAAPAVETGSTDVPVDIPDIPTTRYFRSTFSERDETVANWGIGASDSLSRELVDGNYMRLTSNLPNRALATIYATTERYGSVSVAIEATLEVDSAPASAYGVIFNYQDEDNYNVFGVDGLGRFSIWVREDGEWNELRNADENWTVDDAVRPIGETNLVSVDIVGDRFTGYVNNSRVTRVEDDTFEEGGIGIYFATDDGPASVLVDSFMVYQSVPSMTGP